MDKEELYFKAFPKIPRYETASMAITQKLHGTNAQIYIFKDSFNGMTIYAGNRTRWLTPDDDNYGFAKFVEKNAFELVEILGEGRHFGEWCGKGINSGEGLPSKQLFLFNWRRWQKEALRLAPLGIGSVPVLYEGALSLTVIDETFDRLRTNGSYLVPGFMKPEGIVIQIDGAFYKRVFQPEEIVWKGKKERAAPTAAIDVSHLLQPLRLEKILSRDEKYLREYPVSLPTICREYVNDLESENQLPKGEEEYKLIKKSLGREVFRFIKTILSTKKFT